MSDERRLVNGWVFVNGEQPPRQFVRLRVADARTGTVIAEAVSLPDGQFSVALPPPHHEHRHLLVEAVDSAGELLGREKIAGHCPVIVSIGQAPPEEEEDVGGPALLTGAAADLARRITRWEASGSLPAGSRGVLDAALGRFAWLNGLLEPAQRAILGDTSAAVIVREALSAWAREIPCAASAASVSSPPDEEERSHGEDAARSEPLVSTDAMGTLASAILTSGRTVAEWVELADGLAAVLSVRPWLDALAGAAAAGDMPAMNVMLGAPGPMPLGIPGLGFPGLPGGFPGGKPKGKGVVRVNPTVADVVERFRSPAMLPPSDKERCLIGAMTEVAIRRASIPAYRITELSPADACPGTELAISGRNFGTHGSVVFPGTAKPIPSASAIEWTDGRIRVVVPDGAAPGPITLSILEATLIRCGQIFTVFRDGGSDAPFDGGTAAVTAFLLDGTSDPLRVDPGDLVSISCDVTVHPLARTRVFVTLGGATIADFGTVFGGGHRQHDFVAPTSVGPGTYVVHLLVGGPCGEVEQQRTLTVAAAPRLSIAFIEVTQGLQNSAHTVRLVAGRTTSVRAYLTSGLGSFSYTATPGEVTNVTGTLRVERGGVVIASIPAAAPVTIGSTYADSDRSAALRALVFSVPGALMDGEVTMRVSASVVGLPGFEAETIGTSGTRIVRVEPGGTLNVMRLRMGLSNPAHPAAAPSVADWQASAGGAQDRYPLGDAGMLVRVPSTGEVLSTDHFLGKREGWEDALDELDDFADRFDDFNTIFACTVPRGSFKLNGISHVADDRPWPLENDRRCLLTQAGLRATFAHEMAHTLGVGHAPCADPGTDFPEGIDPSLPVATEPGVVAWRPSNGQLMAPGWSELMSYCTPAGGAYDDRWPSVALWNILLGQLN